MKYPFIRAMLLLCLIGLVLIPAGAQDTTIVVKNATGLYDFQSFSTNGTGKVLWSADGSKLMLQDSYGGGLILDASDWLPIREISPRTDYSGRILAYSPNLVGMVIPNTFQMTTTAFVIIDSENGEVRHTFDAPLLATAAAYHPDGALLAVPDTDGAIHIVNLNGGPDMVALPPGFPVRSLAFSPDGSRLVKVDISGRAVVWSTITGEIVQIQGVQGQEIMAAVFSPDGATLALSLQSPQMLALVPLSDGMEAVTTIGAVEGFEYQGKMVDLYEVPAEDGSIRELALVKPGRKTSQFIDPANPDAGMIEWTGNWRGLQPVFLPGATYLRDCGTTAASFSPDGSLLAAGQDDGSLCLWQVSTGELVNRITTYTAQVMSVAFSPDGMVLATTSADNTARLWGVKP